MTVEGGVQARREIYHVTNTLLAHANAEWTISYVALLQ